MSGASANATGSARRIPYVFGVSSQKSRRKRIIPADAPTTQLLAPLESFSATSVVKAEVVRIARLMSRIRLLKIS